MERHETLTFCTKADEQYRLEIRLRPGGLKTLKLFHKDEELRGVFDRSLRLLQFMAERPKTDVTKNDIMDGLGLEGGPNTVDKYISELRDVLIDSHKEPRFIETVPGGYKFRVDVSREGDLGIDAFPKWNRARFYELLSNVKRGEDEGEDLRIVTTGIGSSVEELDLKGLLRKQLRIKLLFMNPANEGLTDARYSIRQDKPKERGLRELKEQVSEIQKLALQYPPGAKGDKRGTLEFALSNVMPCGFVAHTRGWALLGVFLAHDSYTAGPMLEIRSDSEAWETLYLDWKARWKAAHEQRSKRMRSA
jgi:hypothetical protein